MRIAIVGGGASGMATAYWLNKQGHHVTVLESQPILGGHIRTLNKNVLPNQSECNEILENGVLEFPTVFYNFAALMQELFKDGGHFLSAVAIQKNFTGMQRLIEYLQLDSLYARSAGFILKMRFAKQHDFYNMPLSQTLKRSCVRNDWLKLLTMYSYSIPFELLDDFPAQLAMPVLREYASVNWVRIKGGVYSYIEKILERFKGHILLNVEIAKIFRSADAVKIVLANGEIQEFDKVVFAMPPDQPNYATTVLHSDTSMYDRYGIRKLSEFDFFETDKGWGYNASLNQLCGITSPREYSLAFKLEEAIDKQHIIHIQKHHTPLYTVESFRYRDEVIETNGENNTYHAGAYLGNGLHEGAITSALRVAKLIG
ncbi:MAG: FAD-dependent oxidoreductase [Oscillatoriales cyanobacterium]|nr:MAG: FAD-dependent oxidoreductase [Oscillatoriales cyanobacterium]